MAATVSHVPTVARRPARCLRGQRSRITAPIARRPAVCWQIARCRVCLRDDWPRTLEELESEAAWIVNAAPYHVNGCSRSALVVAVMASWS